jgi:hypothetical protein
LFYLGTALNAPSKVRNIYALINDKLTPHFNVQQEQAIAGLWLSEAFRMSFCKLTLKLAVEAELIAQS